MAANRAFGSAMRSHLDPELAGLLIPLEERGGGSALSQVPDPHAFCKLSKEKDDVPD
ncbi:hypothetical protein [Geminicoccus flavidas]|uniref:hypothetical protein n=1 Tax=Geminicoccus flavidas TaxID=2506407 RepID=UPI001356BFEB|nr:hypothetical protein [Geminicoccus flavidas]